jgi:hypothetical protein
MMKAFISDSTGNVSQLQAPVMLLAVASLRNYVNLYYSFHYMGYLSGENPLTFDI